MFAVPENVVVAVGLCAVDDFVKAGAAFTAVAAAVAVDSFGCYLSAQGKDGSEESDGELHVGGVDVMECEVVIQVVGSDCWND
jgi:hypothetical protein